MEGKINTPNEYQTHGHGTSSKNSSTGGPQTKYIQNLGQTSASNISNALSSIMNESNKTKGNLQTNHNIINLASNTNQSVSSSNANQSNVKMTPSQPTKEPKSYLNQRPQGYGENYYSNAHNVQYNTAKSPKNVPIGSRPLFKNNEDKERPDYNYQTNEKKRTEPDLYPKKFTNPAQMTTSHTSSHVGPSYKYTYQAGSKVSNENSKQSGQTGRHLEETGLNKGVGSKYGILNLGLNRPSGMFKGKE